MELLDKLRSGELTLDTLRDTYGIKIREYGDRLVLNYDQIASDEHKFDPIVRVCRNLIIAKDFSRVLHRSFDRFFNYGEDPEGQKDFDFGKAVVEEKYDGSLVGLYHDGKQWCWCTRSMAFAEGKLDLAPAGHESWRYHDLIRSILGVDHLLANINPAYSYIFELIGPETRVVTPYKQAQLILLAVRDKETGEYVDRVKEGLRLGWDMPEEYSFNSTDLCREMLDYECDPTFEGFVCVCPDGKGGELRVKIKNPRYVALHHARTAGLSTNNIILMVHRHEEEEYLSYFPDDRHLFEPWLNLRELIPRFILVSYNGFRSAPTQKDFALAIKDIPYKDVLFTMRRDYVLWHAKGAEVGVSEVKTVMHNLSEKRVLELYKLFAQ